MDGWGCEHVSLKVTPQDRAKIRNRDADLEGLKGQKGNRLEALKGKWEDRDTNLLDGKPKNVIGNSMGFQ